MFAKSLHSAERQLRHMDRSKLAALAFAFFVVVVLFPQAFSSTGASLRNASEVGIWGLSTPRGVLRFGVVADLDSTSRVQGAATGDCAKDEWRSIFKTGSLWMENGVYNFKFDDEHTLTSKLGEAGRGLELSELVQWQGTLVCFLHISCLKY
jgi:hypothetical protein